MLDNFPRAVITGTGSAVPQRVMTNEEFQDFVDTTDEWIVQRTGIRERRVSNVQETTGSLACEAAQKALKASGLGPQDLDLIVVATVSGEFLWPATACFVQEFLGAGNAAAFDLSAACAGFIYALANVTALLQTGMFKRALLIGADCLTKQMDWYDRSTCILFGDGAAAIVIEARPGGNRGVVQTVLLSDGNGLSNILMEKGGSRFPCGAPHSVGHRDKIFMAGKEVYRFAVTAMGDACERVLEKAGLSAEEIDLFVPHQANLRIIESAAKRLGLPSEKVFVNVDRYGNTSGASIPLALDEAVQTGILRPGMLVLTVGFGAGLVWGANLIRW